MKAVDMHQLRGQVRYQEPMSKHTSWRVGGLADCYYMPDDLEDLQTFLSQLDQGTPLTWLGLGSNTLVRDGGIRGVVIAPLGRIKALKMDDRGLVYAQCGLSNSKFAHFCQARNLTGAGYLAGIPGTIGGALAMNAGAFGSTTWSLVEQVTMMNRQGVLVERFPCEFAVTYRQVTLPVDEWFIAAYFRLSPASDDSADIKQLLQKRHHSQPIGLPSCGSVFKNPPGAYSGQLIEAAGLKGYRCGTAQVSEKHANFIIANRETRASEIEALIVTIQQRIQQMFGIRLETEVRIIGEAA